MQFMLMEFNIFVRKLDSVDNSMPTKFGVGNVNIVMFQLITSEIKNVLIKI